MSNRSLRDVRLRHLGHRNSGLHTNFGAGLFQKVLKGERVHHGAEHSHVVRTTAIHAPLGKFSAAEEVASPDHHGHFGFLGALRDFAGNLSHHIGVDPQLTIAKSFTREL